MTRAIEELLARMPVGPSDIDEFLKCHRFPIVEGSRVTFAFRGDVDRVELEHWVYGLPSSQPLTRLESTDLFYHTMDLPRNSRVEYKLLITRGDDRQLIRDPLNDLLAHDPFGANSVCYASGYETPEWVEPNPEARPGEIAHFGLWSAAFDEERPIAVYLPPRFRTTRRYLLLIVHDGFDYVQYANLKTVLDNLIHRLDIPPLIVALTNSPNRLQEYAANKSHAAFIVHDLLPFIEERFPVVRKPVGRCLMGASFGGVATLFTAWTHPGVFGRLLLQSGSFAFTDIGHHHREAAFDPVVEFINRFRRDPGRPSDKIFVSCGQYESLIYENRSLVPLLRDTGMSVRYTEARDGHNWENWRDRLREGISWVFPGPLWMIYE